MKSIKVKITTAADGSATVDSPRTSGMVYSATYIPDGTNPFPNTADISVTVKGTGEAVLSRTNVAAGFTAYPRVPVSAPDGTASLYAAAGTAVQDKVAVANDQLRIVVAQGGNVKSGTIIFVMD